MTNAEFTNVIHAALLIKGIKGVCAIHPYESGSVHMMAEVFAQFRPADASVRARQSDTDCVWRIQGMEAGVEVYAIATDKELRRLFPDLVPVPEEVRTA